MKKLLYSSIALVLFACGTSEDSMNTNTDFKADSTMTVVDSIAIEIDSLKVDLMDDKDSVHAITHGSPDQEKLDSIKNAKFEEKKK